MYTKICFNEIMIVINSDPREIHYLKQKERKTPETCKWIMINVVPLRSIIKKKDPKKGRRQQPRELQLVIN